MCSMLVKVPAATSVAVAAGMVLAGAVLVAPGMAAPTAGRAAAWGYNGLGQLGNNSTTDTLVPVNTSGVLAGKTVTAISAGDRHTCGIAGGRAYCWGSNYKGQLGNDSTSDASVPVALDTSGTLKGKTVTAISAGYYHSCAIADGGAYCWGANDHGQLGNNSNTNSKVAVP
ncbi:MAG: hypothetical protein R2686_08410 [Candidatus Nanopelagicales bacterium]